MKTLFITLFFLSFFSSINAAVLPVNSTADSGLGSLRDVIATAVNGDTIDVQVTGTTHLTSGQITVSASITIIGPGADVYAIDADSLSRVIQTSSGTDVTIIGLTIRGGNASLGGGIWSFGSLTLIDCGVTDNNSSGPGGGINAISDLVLIRTILYNNRAGSFGGGLVNNFGAVSTFINSTFSDNLANIDGGAIYANGVLNLNHCTIAFNQALDEAGGIYCNTANIFIQNSILAKNTSVNGGEDYYQNVGSINSLGYNLVTVNDDGNCLTCFQSTGDLSGNLAMPLPHGLGMLDDNGGTTPSNLPSSTSLAIDAANPTSGLTEDQRGEARPFGINSDIGSIEFQGSCVIPSGLTAIPGATNVSLSWAAVPTAFGYQIKGRPVGAPGFGTVQTTSTTKTIGGLLSGTTYEWKIRAGCSVDTSDFSALTTFTTAVPRMPVNANISSLLLSPNPAISIVKIQSTPESLLSIYDLNGTLIDFYKIDQSGTTVIQLTDWASGIYMVTNESEFGIRTEKLIIK